jgi:hypothetical protein
MKSTNDSNYLYLTQIAPRLIEHHWDRWKTHYKDFLYPHTIILIAIGFGIEKGIISKIPWVVILLYSLFILIWSFISHIMLIRVHSDLYSIYHTCIEIEKEFTSNTIKAWNHRQKLLEEEFLIKLGILSKFPLPESIGTKMMSYTIFLFSFFEIYLLVFIKINN